jgi:hypothetical protein
MAAKTITPKSAPGAEQQLTALLAKLDPETQQLIQSVRRMLRKRFPAANELAYDYSKNFVLSWSPNERGADAAVAISAAAGGVRFVFNNGVSLPDPYKILLGKAGLIRYINIKSSKDLTQPEVDAMISASAAMLKIPYPESGRGRLIIKESKPAKVSPVKAKTKTKVRTAVNVKTNVKTKAKRTRK